MAFYHLLRGGRAPTCFCSQFENFQLKNISPHPIHPSLSPTPPKKGQMKPTNQKKKKMHPTVSKKPSLRQHQFGTFYLSSNRCVFTRELMGVFSLSFCIISRFGNTLLPGTMHHCGAQTPIRGVSNNYLPRRPNGPNILPEMQNCPDQNCSAVTS